MDSYSFTIDGVGLRTNPGAIESYPEAVDPYDHQVEMERILSNEDDFSAVNTAPTGGGKTWSWVIPCVENNDHVLAAFPTNALAEDQKQSIEEYKQKHTEPGELGVLTLTGASVDRQMAAENSRHSKGKWMANKIREGKLQFDSLIVLTNPDMFMLLRRDMFNSSYAKHHTGFFDVIVFDEFHIADQKGWNSLLFLVDELYADTQRGEDYAKTSKFVFLSATPEEKVYDRLENGMSVPTFHDLTEQTQDGRAPWSKVQDTDGWRAVMPPVNVELRGGKTFETAEDFLADENLPDVLNYCRKGRTVVMLDSMNEVREAHRQLARELPDQTVHRIDGFMSENIEEKLESFDVLVSNSAVEVGIDFDVDQLLMSGYQQKSFLQRIGRLRNKEKQLKAVCYVPRRSLDGFRHQMQQVTSILPGDRPVPRWKFEDTVKDLFPNPRDPTLFPPMYSSIEGFMHIEQKAANMTAESRQKYIPQARRRLDSHFFEPYDWELTEERLTDIINKARSPLNQEDDALVDTLMTYRNGGLTTLVYDETTDQVKTYNLFYFLRCGDIEFETKQAFKDRVPNRHAKQIEQGSRYSTGYCIYHGHLQNDSDDEEDKTRSPRLGATHVLREITELAPEDREPVTIDGIEVRTEQPVPGLEILNRELAQESFLCYPMEGSSYRIQQEFELDDFFSLFDLTDLRGNYSLALGLNALYLHCHLVERFQSKAAPQSHSV
jgi:CRISPR-associated endonuclease/helicase Cas3